MTAAQKKRALDLSTLVLHQGGHTPDSTFCVMEAVAFVSGEKWSDHPKCASVVIGAFLRAWNDGMNDQDRQMLKPLIPRLVGTRGTAAQELRRAWMAVDWLARVQAPAWLEMTPSLRGHADALHCLDEIDGAKAARAAQPRLAAAWAAARDAAWAAAGDAARAAAWDAARDAAWDAAWDAAGAAAWAAAWAAAGDAARAAARPTVVSLQASALQLVERMVEVTA
jgi:hypothetical protein